MVFIIVVSILCCIVFSFLLYYIHMKEIMYLINENIDTGEKHIFIVYRHIGSNKYKKESESICKKIKNDSPIDKNQVFNEEDTRLKAAKIGRSICAECIKTLYTTFE